MVTCYDYTSAQVLNETEVDTLLVGDSLAMVVHGHDTTLPADVATMAAHTAAVRRGIDPVVAAVEEAAEACGWPRESRPWTLHLTQARVRKPWPKAAVERFLEEGRELDVGSFSCGEVVLFSSRLQPGGAVYTTLDLAPLEGVRA